MNMSSTDGRNRLPFFVLALALIGLAGFFVPASSQAQSKNDVFDAVLRDHVKDGYVDYPAIAADSRFAAYLEQLRKTDAQIAAARGETGVLDQRL